MTGPEHPEQWRLARVEVYNWGTFSNLHGFDVARRGHLITGASGSGKSSLLDAIATVLVPQSRIAYNAAALDASARHNDRSRVSYLRGAWSRQVDDASGETATKMLRNGSVSSGILLRYHREAGSHGESPLPVAAAAGPSTAPSAPDETAADPAPVAPLTEDLTLIALFHLRRGATANAEVKDRYLAVRGTPPLSDFIRHLGSGIDDRALKGSWPDALVNTPTHSLFIHRVGTLLDMGADPEQSIELLHRTQSAKNLGSLNQLFRAFMLDEPKTQEVADHAVEVFQDLSQAYRGVVESRAQRDALRALRDPVARYRQQEQQAAAAHALKNALNGWRDRRLLALCRKELAIAADEVTRLQQELTVQEQTARRAQDRMDAARAQLDHVGGARLQAERQRLDTARADLRRISEDRERARRQLESVGVPMPATAAEFELLRRQATEEPGKTAAEQDAQGRLARAFGERQDVEQRLAELRRQIGQLASRPESAIDERLDSARSLIAHSIGLDAAQLPFAAELIGVREDYAPWTGAIERVLRPLSTVLLVPDEHLADVRRVVDAHHLGVRLVFEAVPRTPAPAPKPASTGSIIARLDVRPGPFAGWIARRLSERFDYVCVDGPDELSGVERGVTLAGQVKHGSGRYEKDDRTRVDDPTRWVLTSGRQAKLDRLNGEADELRSRFDAATQQAQNAGAEVRRYERRQQVLADISSQAWERLDVEAARQTETDIQGRIRSLTEGNDDLQAAQHRLDEAAQALSTAQTEVSAMTQALGAAKDRHRSVSRQADDLKAELKTAPPLPEAASTALDERSRARRRSLSRDTIDLVVREIGDELLDEASQAERARNRAASEFERRAGGFLHDWPALGGGIGPGIEFRDDFARILERIERARLPEYVAKFRKLLRTQSQQQTAELRSLLNLAISEVRDKIKPINESLLRSPFDQGRFLQIRVEDVRGSEVREFLDQLKTITSGSWDRSTEAEDEARYHVLDAVIGRLGSDDSADRAWRGRVLDSRRHVGFTAEEVTGTGELANSYGSSAGLSGGQRQKLVIFCLAAALRYRLARPDHLYPDFGTVILDEAFDKADSAFTRMAMDVFFSFGFHLVLATPLKLLQTLGDYMGAVTQVECRDHRASSVGTIIIRDQGAAE
jgi:uncharacterized protein YPO0396